MMIIPEGRLGELEDKYFAEEDEEKRKEMLPELEKLWEEEEEELKDCPFMH